MTAHTIALLDIESVRDSFSAVRSSLSGPYVSAEYGEHQMTPPNRLNVGFYERDEKKHIR